MQRISHVNGVVTYTFDSLAGLPVRAHISTRHGGVSPEPWSSLNFSVARGDDPDRVRVNRARFADALGLRPGQAVSCRQVHGTGVVKADWDHAGATQEGADALVTDELELPLSLVFADCVPVLLYDRDHHALGICHAGWRGTVNGAAAATLWAMQAAYDTDPARVAVCIGPSIGPESYEVGEEVSDLAHARLPDAGRYFDYPNGRERRPHFDLWRANADQLIEAGVAQSHIEIAGIDTAKRTDDFFSHRGEQGRCGLFGLMAWLLPPAKSGALHDANTV